jgi:hypothetical protein
MVAPRGDGSWSELLPALHQRAEVTDRAEVLEFVGVGLVEHRANLAVHHVDGQDADQLVRGLSSRSAGWPLACAASARAPTCSPRRVRPSRKGATGQCLVPLLVGAGHSVVATTRSPAKAAGPASAGAEPVVVDGLDREAVRETVLAASPDAVIHQLTALGEATGNLKRLDQEFALTNKLRTTGLDHLLAAAQVAGAQRFQRPEPRRMDQPSGPRSLGLPRAPNEPAGAYPSPPNGGLLRSFFPWQETARGADVATFSAEFLATTFSLARDCAGETDVATFGAAWLSNHRGAAKQPLGRTTSSSGCGRSRRRTVGAVVDHKRGEYERPGEDQPGYRHRSARRAQGNHASRSAVANQSPARRRIWPVRL